MSANRCVYECLYILIDCAILVLCLLVWNSCSFHSVISLKHAVSKKHNYPVTMDFLTSPISLMYATEDTGHPVVRHDFSKQTEFSRSRGLYSVSFESLVSRVRFHIYGIGLVGDICMLTFT